MLYKNGKRRWLVMIQTSNIHDIVMFILNKSKLYNENGSIEDVTKEVVQNYELAQQTLLAEITRKK
jgi:hypothetical protein